MNGWQPCFFFFFFFFFLLFLLSARFLFILIVYAKSPICLEIFLIIFDRNVHHVKEVYLMHEWQLLLLWFFRYLPLYFQGKHIYTLLIIYQGTPSPIYIIIHIYIYIYIYIWRGGGDMRHQHCKYPFLCFF